MTYICTKCILTKIIVSSNIKITIPKNWCCIFRGDIHHAGAAYSTQNDRLHFYLKPSKKRKRNGKYIYAVTNTRIPHTILPDNRIFGLGISNTRVYFLIKKCTKSTTLFWERRPTYIQKYLKEAVRDLCLDLHKYQKEEKGMESAASKAKCDIYIGGMGIHQA